jgi:hypothetical protein
VVKLLLDLNFAKVLFGSLTIDNAVFVDNFYGTIHSGDFVHCSPDGSMCAIPNVFVKLVGFFDDGIALFYKGCCTEKQLLGFRDVDVNRLLCVGYPATHLNTERRCSK